MKYRGHFFTILHRSPARRPVADSSLAQNGCLAVAAGADVFQERVAGRAGSSGSRLFDPPAVDRDR